MSLLRAFVAIELSPETRARIARQVAPLREELGGALIRWTPIENAHLTLKFLGDVSSSRLPFIKQMISQSAESYAPFDLRVGGLGCYPNARSPRVLWLGVHAPPALASLQKSVESGAARLRCGTEERAFSPHLTIGRVKQNANPAEQPKIQNALRNARADEAGVERVSAIHLFQSELTSNGSIYTRLFSAPLKANPNSSMR